MKSQRIVKSGAAIGGAVGLLLMSAFLPPSPALAGGGKISAIGKLSATGLEPQASAQAKLTATPAAGGWGVFYSVGVTVSCKGLTPGKHYYLVIEGDSGTWYGSDGVASRTGVLELRGGFQSLVGGGPIPCYVSIHSDAGLVLWGSSWD